MRCRATNGLGDDLLGIAVRVDVGVVHNLDRVADASDDRGVELMTA